MNNKALERSVNHLQILFSIVFGISITTLLSKITTIINDIGYKNMKIYIPYLLMGLSYFILVIPFYHGANRYMDQTYILNNDKNEKRFSLMIDFFFLFFEGVIFLILSLLIKNIHWFYIIICLLLFYDFLWVGLSFLYNNCEQIKKNNTKYKWWGICNVITGIIILLSNSINIWTDVIYLHIFIFILLFIRSVLDYILVWDFYFPQKA